MLSPPAPYLLIPVFPELLVLATTLYPVEYHLAVKPPVKISDWKSLRRIPYL